MEGMWSDLPDREKERNRKELTAIEEQLLRAATDPDAFSRLLTDLQAQPPHFKMPDDGRFR
jgi:hypothetical protein